MGTRDVASVLRSANTPRCLWTNRGLRLESPCRGHCNNDGSRPGSTMADDPFDGPRRLVLENESEYMVLLFIRLIREMGITLFIQVRVGMHLNLGAVLEDVLPFT